MSQNDLITFAFEQNDKSRQMLLEPHLVEELAQQVQSLAQLFLDETSDQKIARQSNRAGYQAKIWLAGARAGSIWISYLLEIAVQHKEQVEAVNAAFDLAKNIGETMILAGVLWKMFKPTSQDNEQLERLAHIEDRLRHLENQQAAFQHYEALIRLCKNSGADSVSLTIQGQTANILTISSRNFAEVGSRASRLVSEHGLFEGYIINATGPFKFDRHTEREAGVEDLYRAEVMDDELRYPVLIKWGSKRSINEFGGRAIRVEGSMAPLAEVRGYTSTVALDPSLYDVQGFLIVNKVHVAE